MAPAILVPHHERGADGPPRPPLDRGDDRSPWRPAPEPPPLDNARLGLLFFLGAEAMLFASLVAGYFVVRVQSVVWPPPLQPRLPIGVTGLNTLALLLSSLAMASATRALWRGERERLLRRLGTTAGLGALFLLVQGFEWVRLIHFGLTVTSGAYGATFYTIIGAHGFHVLIALTWLLVVLFATRAGRIGMNRPLPVAVCAMYWHFVVALWPILYVLVYLV
jgi:heme/copper-type cytochrome/quinol oxidase subunit 3